MAQRKQHPLVLRWNELPIRPIRAPGQKRKPLWFERDSRGASGSLHQPFDFSMGIQRLVMDIATRFPEFRHLIVPRILVSVAQARGRAAHGLQARVTPMRFSGGELTRMRRGVPFHIQRYFLGEHEYLYLMTFMLPRFQDQSFEEKLITLFHELYHISPAFDGDLRRHDGRYELHTHSQREYDKQMADLAREYLRMKPEPALYSFLRMTFAQLEEQHGGVTGVVVPRPKIIPLIEPYVNSAAAKSGKASRAP